MAIETFTWAPESIEDEQILFNVIETVFENKKKQRALKSAVPEQSWRLLLRGLTNAELSEVFDFYTARSGMYEAFYWYHSFDYTLNTAVEPVTETIITLDATLRIREDDYVRFGEDVGQIYKVASKVTGSSITLTQGLSQQLEIGTKVEVRYLVCFGEALSWPTFMTYVRECGLLFIKDIV